MPHRLVAWSPSVQNRLRLFLTIIFISAILVIPCYVSNVSADASHKQKASVDDEWASFGHDARNTRTSSSSVPNFPNLLWSFYDGSALWSPVVSNGRVFTGSYNANELCCLNETDGTLLWKFVSKSSFDNSPAVFENKLFAGSSTRYGLAASEGMFYCLDTSTGALIWNVTLDGWIYHSSPVVSEGMIFIEGLPVETVDAHLFCLNMTDGEQIWNCSILNTCPLDVECSPAVADGRVFGGNFCVNESTGGILWTYPQGEPSIGNTTPAVVNGKVFLGWGDNVVCLNENDGSSVWNLNISGADGADSIPAVANGVVFMPSAQSILYALNATTGAQIWNYTILGGISSSPSVADGVVLISAPDISGEVMALNATDGTFLWKYKATIGYATIAIANGRIFYSAVDPYDTGTIICIGSPYSLTIAPSFEDNYGNPLNVSPSQWTVLFPNETLFYVFSGSVTYPQVLNGNYSIVGVVWLGDEVVPDQKPTLTLSSDSFWTPIVRCKLPIYVSVHLTTATSLVGFIRVNINGRVADYKNANLIGFPITLMFSITNLGSWNDIALVNTGIDGTYDSEWFPAATGSYLVEAFWGGNSTFSPTTSIESLAVESYQSQYVFAVESNSTLSNLTFDASNSKLIFSVSGENGTSGYARVTIAKSLIADANKLLVSIDGATYNYTLSDTSDAWIVAFTYEHSTHAVEVDLEAAMVSEYTMPIVFLMFLSAALITAFLCRLRTRKLCGDFRR